MADIKKQNVILELTKEFSLSVIEFVEVLEDNRKYVIAKQLLKSATSIGVNVNEAQNSESKIDFIHKMKIAAKESAETAYWLFLCEHSKSYPDPKHLIKKQQSIDRVLGKIISTSKKQIKVFHK